MDGCKRGTTTLPPPVTIICGKCWRKAPDYMRKRWSRLRRRATLADKRGDVEQGRRWEAMATRVFWRIHRVLQGDGEAGQGMNPLMAEQLRKDGLL